MVRQWTTLRRAIVGGLAASALLAGGALAQDLPGSNNGPQFGQWGPNQSAPAPQTNAPSGGVGAPAPGAAAPGAPAPAPSPNWGGCNYYMGGEWHYHGEESQPTAFLYEGNVQVNQYQNWLEATEYQGNGSVTQYYGQCNGNNLRFDVYQNGQWVGYQAGDISQGWRWGERTNFRWITWTPGSGQQSTGRESWQRD